MNKGITVFTPTQGRLTGLMTVRSFISQLLEPEDRMVILGDDVDRPDWAYGPQVEFVRCPKTAYYGHDHIYKRLGEVTTPYWAFIGDDDVYLPGTFTMVRDWMNGGILLGSTIIPNGEVLYAIHARMSIPGKFATGFLQAFIPRAYEVPDFSTMLDCDLLEKLIDRYGFGTLRKLPSPVTMARIHESSPEVWERYNLGLGAWEEWKK